MNTTNFTWTKIYSELASKLLQFKNDRQPLVEWIYSGLGLIAGPDGKNFIGYIHNEDKSNVTDIDPFSVMAIFNRGKMTRENRLRILTEFKDHFDLESELPTDFNGIPVLDPRRSFFFSWKDDREESINTLWSMFEKAVKCEPFEAEYNQTVARSGIRFGLSMALFWICSKDFLSLDSRNREFLNAHGLEVKDKAPDYKNYIELINLVKGKFEDGSLDGVGSFCEMSHKAWLDAPAENQKVWLWAGDETSFESNLLKAGDSVSELVPDFSIFSTKQELRSACQKAKNNTEVSISKAYWQFMTEVSVGDIVVIFKNKRSGGKNIHLMYGWGTITSELIHVPGDVAPIQRTVEWNTERPSEPVEDTLLNNSLFFHQANDAQAENIKALLGIGGGTEYKTFWLAGYTFNSEGSQFDRFLREGIWEGYNGNKRSFRFEEIKEGDVLLMKSSYTRGPRTASTSCLKVKAIAVVESSGERINDDGYRFQVDYIIVDEKEFTNQVGGYQGTLHLCKNEEIIEWAKQVLKNKGANKESMKKRMKKYSEYIDLLKSNSNLILTGAPGTGKTYLAKMIAEEMGAETEFVQFHPSYDYTDFVEGLRPTEGNSFVRRDGIFKEFCKKALRNTEHSFVFIIDEINRGEMSKILGELFFSIDPGYRGEKGRVKTQYQNLVDETDVFAKGFFIPENVYIIGTMNDIDRSVESMDFAIRRRFTWKEVLPEDRIDMWDDCTGDWKEEARQRMSRMNAIISDGTVDLSSEYCIGPAYFRNLEKNGSDFAKLWKLHLEPLIKEYLRGNRNIKDNLEKIKKVFDLVDESEQDNNDLR